MTKGKTIYAIWIALVFLSLFSGPVWGETKPVGFAIPFPDLTFTQTLSEEDQAHLGIMQERFSIKEIRGNLILLEFISIYCASCQKQAPILNELYSSIEKDPRLRGKVKMVGIAAASLSVAVASLPTLLAQTKYSRGFEAAADEYAFRLLKQKGYSPAAFASLMERLAKKHEKDTGAFAYTSTHPVTAERVQHARDAAAK